MKPPVVCCLACPTRPLVERRTQMEAVFRRIYEEPALKETTEEGRRILREHGRDAYREFRAGNMPAAVYSAEVAGEWCRETVECHTSRIQLDVDEVPAGKAEEARDQIHAALTSAELTHVGPSGNSVRVIARVCRGRTGGRRISVSQHGKAWELAAKELLERTGYKADPDARDVVRLGYINHDRGVLFRADPKALILPGRAKWEPEDETASAVLHAGEVARYFAGLTNRPDNIREDGTARTHWNLITGVIFRLSGQPWVIVEKAVIEFLRCVRHRRTQAEYIEEARVCWQGFQDGRYRKHSDRRFTDFAGSVLAYGPLPDWATRAPKDIADAAKRLEIAPEVVMKVWLLATRYCERYESRIFFAEQRGLAERLGSSQTRISLAFQILTTTGRLKLHKQGGRHLANEYELRWRHGEEQLGFPNPLPNHSRREGTTTVIR